MKEIERIDQLRNLGFSASTIQLAKTEPPHKSFTELFECTYSEPWKFYHQPKGSFVPVLEHGTTVIAANASGKVVEFSLEEPETLRFEISENNFLLLMLARAAIERYEDEQNVGQIFSDLREAIDILELSKQSEVLDKLTNYKNEEEFYDLLFELEDDLRNKS